MSQTQPDLKSLLKAAKLSPISSFPDGESIRQFNAVAVNQRVKELVNNLRQTQITLNAIIDYLVTK